MSENINSFQLLDVTGLICPEPVMLLHQRIRAMLSGNVIRVIATDPSTTRDIPKFCHYLGHKLLDQSEGSGQYCFIIEKQ